MTESLQAAQRAACAEVGVTYRDVPMDGRWHATNVEGDTRGRGDGRIKVFPDGRGGIVWNWKGERRTFFIDDGQRLNETERRERDRQRAEARREAQEDTERRRAEAADKARAIWKAATPALPDHPYLARKQVQPVATLRELPASNVAALLGYAPKAGGEVLVGRLIVAPVQVGARLSTLELIDEAGRKSAIRDGQKCGGYWPAQKLPQEGDSGGLRLLIAEGIATALSAQAATGYPVIAALSCGNLQPVAKAMRERYPAATLVVLADLGNGQSHAELAARTAGALVALPRFDAGPPEGATDFNDMAQHCGNEAVKRCIEASASCDSFESTGEKWPETLPLEDALPPVDKIAADLLPNALQPWAADVAERTQAPLEYVAVALMVALGAAIGRKLAIRPKRLDDWYEFANLWGAVIGPPSWMKSPALDAGTRALRLIENRNLELYESTRLEWEMEVEATKIKRDAARDRARKAASKGNAFDMDSLVAQQVPEEPRAPRLIVNDATVPALCEVLRGNPNGVMVFRDELAGLIAELDREGMEGSRGFYLSAWSGKEAYTQDRIMRGTNLRVPHVCLSLLGGIQPARIGPLLRDSISTGGGDGFLARFSLTVWPDSPGEYRSIDREPNDDARRAAQAVHDRLHTFEPENVGAEFIDGASPFLRLDPDAADTFATWDVSLRNRLRAGNDDGALSAHLMKFPKAVCGLALIAHLADGGTGPVTERAVLRSLAWAEFLESHARRMYASLGQAHVDSARSLLRRIRRGDLVSPFSLRDVYRQGWANLADIDAARAATDLLESRYYIRSREVPSGHAGGRPSTAYVVNPETYRVQS